MRRGLVASLLLILDTVSCDASKRDLAARTPRVVGGAEDKAFDKPWLVSLQEEADGKFQHQCGGTLVHARWVLSAAHCFDDATPSKWRVGVSRFDISLAASDDGPCSQDISAKRIIKHEAYEGGQKIINDIALIELSEDAKCASSNAMMIAKLDGSSSLLTDRSGRKQPSQAAGWGAVYDGHHMAYRCKTTEGSYAFYNYDMTSDEFIASCESNPGHDPAVLDTIGGAQYPTKPRVLTDLPVQPSATCEEINQADYSSETQLCAGYYPEGGKDTCTGDSGGPLVLPGNAGESSGVPATLVGIVSYGGGCAVVNGVGVYTRVSAFLSWIYENAPEVASGNPSPGLSWTTTLVIIIVVAVNGVLIIAVLCWFFRKRRRRKEMTSPAGAAAAGPVAGPRPV